MRSPERVLNSLSEHSKDVSYKFERLYRILFNEEMFYVAYQHIYAKEGNMTKGSDGQTIDNMSLKRIEKLIDTLKDETYQPQPSKRVYIPKKNGKKRPLGVPTFNDKLIQEVVRMVLEAIYEGNFEYTSHGFRPNRSCHTALTHIQKEFSGAKWFVEGDIKGFFDNISHDVLINILKERIADERFIRLVRKFLKAGYIEEWQFHNTYSGTPQGGIISPILANIYLDKLDKYIKEYTAKFDKGKKRKFSRESMDFGNARKRIVRRLKFVKDERQRTKLILELKAIEQGRAKYPNGEEMDADYRRMKYARYADDFLVGIIGSKQDAQQIKEDIKKLDKKGYEVSFFTKDKDRGVGEGETKNLQFEVQTQTPSFEEKDSSSPFTPSFEKTEKKDSDAPSIPSFKKEEEETVQSEVSQTPSPNQKFIDMLIRDMMEEYPEGDTPKWMELKKTFSELKEDYFSHDEELSRLEIEDLFPYFESRGCRVGIHYSEWKEKTEEEIREEFMSLPVSENYDESLISLSDDEKIEMIKEDFRESFPVDEKVTLDEMRQFVVEYMRDLELLRIGRVQYDNPQLLSFMFPELQMDKETKLWFRSQNKARGETICSDGGKMIEIQLKFREEAENARKQENPFYKKLERYRFPRISIGENRDCQAIEIIPKLLSDMGYKNGDMEDWDTISQLLDVIIDRYKLYGSGFEPFRGIWVYLDKYDHKQKGKVQVRNLPEK